MRALLALFAIGCGQRGESAPAPPPKQVVAVAIDAGAPAVLVRAPHTNEISLVAASDAGDAALTADTTGELRFWPSLDGKHEPVVMRSNVPIDLAMTREHDGHVAAILDNASGIELLRIGRDGAIRSREVIGAEPGFSELAAGTTALLARRNDHAIVRLDANLTKGTRALASEQGEQIVSIAARRAHAIAAIADRDRPNEIHVVRRIELRDGLAWGASMQLPVPLAAPIALSPSGTRVAGLHARNGAGVIIELGAKPRVVASDIIGNDELQEVLGFLDDERAVMRGGVVVAAPQVSATPDPWSGTRSTVRVRVGRGSIVVDNMLVAGHGTHVMLADPDRAQFLGYRDLGVGSLRVTGKRITLGFGNRVLWLDDKLALVRAHDVLNDAAGGIAIDEHRILKGTYSYLEHDRSMYDVSVLDVTTGREESLGSWSQGSSVAYDPDTSVFAVAGSLSTIPRLRLDVATGKATPLRHLDPKAREAFVEIVDPAQADGVVAVAYTFGTNSETEMRIETFVDDKGRGPISPATSVTLDDASSPLGVDRSGTMYTLASRPEGQPKPIYAHKAGKEVKRVMVEASILAASVDRTGTLLAVYSSSHVALLEDGKERWRIPAWSINAVRFTDDGKTLFVNTQGGMLAVDVATGARTSTGCGWGFGMSTVEPQLTVFLAPVVCAEAL